MDREDLITRIICIAALVGSLVAVLIVIVNHV